MKQILKDVMTPDVQCIGPSASLTECARLMNEMDTSSVPVCDNDRLVGTVTAHDLVTRAVSAGADANTRTVREVMKKGIHYCFEDQSVDEAAQLMKDKQVGRICVLDRNKRLCGMLSLRNLETHGLNVEAQGLKSAA